MGFQHTAESLRGRTTVNVVTGCWEWRGTKDKNGYGKVILGGKPKRTHRLMWQLTVGPIVNGLWVLHRCDNPRCCNPDHLFLGTHADNQADCKAKGRSRQGVNNGRAKLTPDLAAVIRQRHVPKRVTRKQLAIEFGVSESTVKKVLRGERWN